MIQSPPPEYNFDPVPTVHTLDEFWHRKYRDDENGRLVRAARTEDVVQAGDSVGVHLPGPSYWPIVLAAGFPILGYGLIFKNIFLLGVGLLTIVAAMYGWAAEPADDPNAAHGHGDHEPGDVHGDGGDQPAVEAGGDGDGGDGEGDTGAQAGLPKRETVEEVNPVG
jgi:cytochrome c oxidase subunit 1